MYTHAADTLPERTGATAERSITMDYAIYTNEELVDLITAGDETAYEQLFRNLRPIILHEAQIYQRKMEIYDSGDFLQEGWILTWQIISRGNYRATDASFSTYFGSALRQRLCRLWRDYCLKNPVCIGENVDWCGNTSRILVESDYAKEYRAKERERAKRNYEKKKADRPSKKETMSKQERNKKIMAWQKKYYAEHPDKLAERREKNRIAERERRARKKAATV